MSDQREREAFASSIIKEARQARIRGDVLEVRWAPDGFEGNRPELLVDGMPHYGFSQALSHKWQGWQARAQQDISEVEREWQHGCDALCMNVTLFTPVAMRCPHCGRPAPKTAQQQGEEGGGDA